MLIGELAARTGVSARSLRHYEEQGLLAPGRGSGGYRRYAESDVVRVLRIRAMVRAGVGTATVRRYLGCVRDGADGARLEMCPGLRAELDAVAGRLDAREAEVRETRGRLERLVGDG
ncbi:MerR family transcriptional regulator [Streptomyces sp. DSM 110735]|uniref:MerR family transcriptional regulator n=1 Tax=Streptomyces sp. DSM 110735 TaxID=2775031 RepID=UPI0018F57EB2|nr:MerR family transcriptional regulator [Streptomyces sp. DSM 110735]MBJ7906296.1 MerR family transcriptional regulator [Streptomyces sp. DSM 110735]